MREHKRNAHSADEVPAKLCPPRRRASAYATVLCLTLAPAATCAAQQISVLKGKCGAGVHLVAKDARLSDVLKRLSQTLEFPLQFEGVNDPVINVDTVRPAPELVSKLSPGDNIMVTQAADPRCPREYRIVKVWVLPKANAATVAPPAPARPVTTAAPQSSSPYTPNQLDEMSKQRKAAYDAYVKEHGVPPPPAED